MKLLKIILILTILNTLIYYDNHTDHWTQYIAQALYGGSLGWILAGYYTKPTCSTK